MYDGADGMAGLGELVPADSAESTGHDYPQSPGWRKRICVGRAPPYRTYCADRQSALEKSVRCYTEILGDEVIDTCLGTTFDSLSEAYDFCNLYSWEHGSGIRYGKRRLNSENTKCMQEIACGYSGKPTSENTTSCRRECTAMIQMLCVD